MTNKLANYDQGCQTMTRTFQPSVNCYTSSSGGALPLPCNPNGGSPFLYQDYSRVAGPIFTGPYNLHYYHCGRAFEKPMGNSGGVRRRVDWSSSKNSTKDHAMRRPVYSSMPSITSKPLGGHA